MISLSFYAFYKLNNFVAILLVPFVATRMYALYSLLHDGIHFLLHSNRKVNDFVGIVFLATPLFVSLKTMRKAHFMHHQHLLSDLDPEIKHRAFPEFRFPLSKKQLLTIVFLDLTGINFLKYQFLKLKALSTLSSPLKFKLLLLQTFKILIVLAFLILSYNCFVCRAIVVLWFIPYATFYQVLNRLRLYLEHNNLSHSASQTRSLIFHPFLSFFVCPHNLGYHAAHHQYPNIPFYNLQKAHAFLKTLGKTNFEEENKLFNALNKLAKDD